MNYTWWSPLHTSLSRSCDFENKLGQQPKVVYVMAIMSLVVRPFLWCFFLRVGLHLVPQIAEILALETAISMQSFCFTIIITCMTTHWVIPLFNISQSSICHEVVWDSEIIANYRKTIILTQKNEQNSEGSLSVISKSIL